MSNAHYMDVISLLRSRYIDRYAKTLVIVNIKTESHYSWYTLIAAAVANFRFFLIMSSH